MKNEYINLYWNGVTKGEQDGTIISQDGELISPLTVSLDANINEEKYFLCAVRTEDGYKSSRTSISFNGDSKNKWKVADDNNYIDEEDAKLNATFDNELVIEDMIDNTNHLFWIKAASSDDEKPRKDVSVTIHVNSYVVTE